MSITALPMPPGGIDRATYDYLFRVTEQLNLALANLGAENFAPESAARTILKGDLSEGQRKEMQSALASLKSLIIKTADAAEAEIETLETQLKSRYVAASDFGAYQEEIAAQLTATAEQIEQAIAYYAEMEDALHGVSEEFDAYTVEVQGYIRQGIIGYDGAAPVIGISPPRSDGSVVPNRPLEGNGFGSMERGMFSSARISSSQSSVLMLKSIVREALE